MGWGWTWSLAGRGGEGREQAGSRCRRASLSRLGRACGLGLAMRPPGSARVSPPPPASPACPLHSPRHCVPACLRLPTVSMATVTMAMTPGHCTTAGGAQRWRPWQWGCRYVTAAVAVVWAVVCAWCLRLYHSPRRPLLDPARPHQPVLTRVGQLPSRASWQPAACAAGAAPPFGHGNLPMRLAKDVWLLVVRCTAGDCD